MNTSESTKHKRLKVKFELTHDQRTQLAPLFAQVEEHNKTPAGPRIAIFAQVYRDGCVAITLGPGEVAGVKAALGTEATSHRTTAFDWWESRAKGAE